MKLFEYSAVLKLQRDETNFTRSRSHVKIEFVEIQIILDKLDKILGAGIDGRKNPFDITVRYDQTDDVVWEDELKVFVRRTSLPDLRSGSDGVVWTTILEGKGELAVDASCGTRASVYVLVQQDHPTVSALLRGLQLCDPAKTVGFLLHCIADDEDRVGFLINLDSRQMHADALCTATAQILHALMRMQQG